MQTHANTHTHTHLTNNLSCPGCAARTDPLPPVTQAPPQPPPSGGSGGATGGSGFCAGKANSLFPDPTNKNHFYECSQGVTYTQHCAAGLVFDASCSCCNWA